MKENEKEFYDQIKDWDFSKFEIVSESLTNWDLYEELRKVTNEESKVLDLGTGGGEKVINNFPSYVKEVLGTDFSEAMIATANKNLKESGKTNTTFRTMDNLHMDTPKDYFDVVVARNTVTDPKQIYETLKPGGYLIIRGVDKDDCHELKKIFEKGNAYFDKTPISIIDYNNVLEAGFNDVELIPLHEREYYKTKELLLGFLLKVPIINDFSDESEKGIDEEKLDCYIGRNTYPKGIRLLRRYYGITARK